MYRIGVFSKLSRTTIKALRYYDEEGLLKPEATDRFTSYRLYTTKQLVELHRIQSLRQVGLSIDEIKLIQSGRVDADVILKKRKAEMLAELATTQDRLSRIEFILSGQEEELFMSYRAMVKELPECIVYSKEAVIPGYDTYFELIPSIGAKVVEKYPDLKCATPEYCFVRYLDGEYRETNFRIEFCEAVEKLKADFDDIKFKKMDAVSAVCVMHKGSYGTLSGAYAFLTRWIEENQYLMIDSPRESYLDGIWNRESEADWLTEIQFPVVKKG